MTILDWFDVGNIKHLQAYKQLQNTGTWPEAFIPKGTKFTASWQICLANRFVDKFIEEKFSESYYEDYSYYVGGEITCGRMPLKYMQWIAAGRPA